MDDVQRVQVAHALQQVPEQLRDLGLAEGLPFLLAVLEQRAQGAAANQLHLDHEAALALVELVELHDVRVVQGGKDLRLLGEEADLGGRHGFFGDGLVRAEVP